MVTRMHHNVTRILPIILQPQYVYWAVPTDSLRIIRVNFNLKIHEYVRRTKTVTYYSTWTPLSSECATRLTDSSIQCTDNTWSCSPGTTDRPTDHQFAVRLPFHHPAIRSLACSIIKLPCCELNNGFWIFCSTVPCST